MHTLPDSQKYHSVKRLLFFIGLGIDCALFLMLLMSGVSVWIRTLSLHINTAPVLANGIYVILIMGLMHIVHFPLRYFEGFAWEHRFALSRQRFSAWLLDDIKKALIGLCIALLAIEAVYFFLGRFAETWWMFAAGFWILLTVVLARITPKIIIPLFFKYSDVENPELKRRILALFKKTHIPIKDVYAVNFSAKTKKANAFVCGLGKNRRVALSDTLIADFSIPEIEAVIAHEIAHYKRHDIIKLLAVNACLIFAGFYLVHMLLGAGAVFFGFSRLDDIALFPLLALVFILFGFIVTPLSNWLSRVIESQADDFSLRLTGAPDDFISMMNKLGMMNLAEFNPSFLTEIFFYDHPPLAKRIAYAQNFKNA